MKHSAHIVIVLIVAGLLAVPAMLCCGQAAGVSSMPESSLPAMVTTRASLPMGDGLHLKVHEAACCSAASCVGITSQEVSLSSSIDEKPTDQWPVLNLANHNPDLLIRPPIA